MSLFGGLIYVHNWAFEKLPCAMADIMMADLPHIKYTPQSVINKRKAEEAARRTIEVQERTKRFGLGIAFSNQKSVAEAFNNA